MVCATKQHTGKTSVALAMLHSLRKKSRGSVGYMKPVGQQWVEAIEGGVAHRMDKDAAVAKAFFRLTDSAASISPVVIGQGDTKAFLDDAAPALEDTALTTKLQAAFPTLCSTNDFVVVEGTGHCAVGSVLGWSNARVAAALGIEIVLVANGGIGSTFDELALNMMACRAENARVLGIVINKCAPHKVDEVTRYLQLASDRFGWNVPILGCVPYAADLDKPSVMDLEHLFEGGFSRPTRYDPSTSSSNVVGAKPLLAPPATMDKNGDNPDEGREPVLLAGADQRSVRFSHYELVTSSLERYMQKLVGTGKEGCTEFERFTGNKPESDSGLQVGFITHISRSDIIQGLLGHRALVAAQEAQPRPQAQPRPHAGGGLIIAGAIEHTPEPFLVEYIRASSIPVMRSYMDVTKTMTAVRNLTPKMQAEDAQRVQNVIGLYEPHLDRACDHILESG